MSRLAFVTLLVWSCTRSTGSDRVVSSGDTARQPPAGASGTHDWTRFGWNAARSNASMDSTGITAANVATLERQQVTLDGTVDASAIYLHRVEIGGATRDAFFVTTSYGKTIAIDANDGTILWRFTPPDYSTFASSSRITNSTPVADPDRQAIYAAAPDGFIRKLAVSDGHVVWGTAITTLPSREKIAAALNYDRGHVIATTGGYIGDAPPYQGHVAVLDASSGALVQVWNALCSDRPGLIAPSSCAQRGSAIWARVGAVIDPTTGNILVATGDGLWDGSTNWGDAVIELDPTATRVVANYTPLNTKTLETSDIDLGSTGPVLLGGGLVAQSGKDGVVRVLDRTRMSGRTGPQGQEVPTVAPPGSNGLFNAPAVLSTSSGTWMFVADAGATAAWNLSGSQLQPVWQSSTGGTSPVYAAGLLYVYDKSGALLVYDAQSGRQLQRFAVGQGHWNSPIVVDGKIAIPEGNANDHRTSGVFNIFRLP